MLHVDGTYRKTDDVRVGGYVLSRELRADQLHRAEHELGEGHADEAGGRSERGRQAAWSPDQNSGMRTYTPGGGGALIRWRQPRLLGRLLRHQLRRADPPPPAAHGHEEEEGEGGHDHGEGPVMIGLKQWRADMRGEVNVDGGFLDKIRVCAGYSDYQHTEFEGAEIGTQFFSQGHGGPARAGPSRSRRLARRDGLSRVHPRILGN